MLDNDVINIGPSTAECVTATSDAAHRRGLTKQLGRLYTDNKAKLHRFLVHRLGNARDAEDVVHEVFVRLMTICDIGPIDNPTALLRRIAVNIIHDGFRAKRFRRRQTEGLTGPICSVQPEPDPEATASARQRLVLVQNAINDLPPRCREVFLQHKIQGKSHSEVAAALGISRNMVEKHIIRAYTHLRTVLDDSRAGAVDNPPKQNA